MYANFNPYVEGTNFPEILVEESTFNALCLPKTGDPGFVIVSAHGAWAWVRDMPTALELAGNRLAIYRAMDCGPYFHSFEVNKTINADGQEVNA